MAASICICIAPGKRNEEFRKCGARVKVFDSPLTVSQGLTGSHKQIAAEFATPTQFFSALLMHSASQLKARIGRGGDHDAR